MQTNEGDDVEKGFDKNDVYGYTKTERFTSEVFKIEIKNIPKHFGYNNWKKLFKKLKLNPHKINAIPKIQKVYVTFRNEDDRKLALEKINGYAVKGTVLQAKHAKPKEDAMAKKRPHAGDDDEGDQKKLLKLDPASVEEMLKDSVVPWWNIEYDMQLKRKQDSVVEHLTNFRKHLTDIKNLDKEIFVWMMQQKHDSGTMCPLLPILPSPVTHSYRNKCSFTIGHDSAGNIAVGNRIGRYTDQNCAVEPPACLPHVPAKMKSICHSVTSYVALSELDVYNPHSHEGYWKQLTVRTTQQDAALAVVCLCRQNLSDERLREEQDKLRDHLERDHVTVDTLLFHPVAARERSQATNNNTVAVVTGDGFIYEHLLGNKFRVSPQAFFQCNTPAAEVLYSTVADMTSSSDDATAMTSSKRRVLIDLCCGTGTIGISLAGKFDHVIGVDSCKEAIADAIANSRLNDVTNVKFHAGKAEEVLPRVVKALASDCRVVAVVDPPRCGLHAKVMATIRSCAQIKQLVYVSCSIAQARTNFVDLCRPASKKLAGPPFKPVLARSLDLFPHTPHVEVVVHFTRIDDVTPAPCIDDVTPAPRIDDVTPPAIDDVTPAPRIDDVTPPAIDDVTPAPRIDDVTSAPLIDDVTPAPRIDDVTPPAIDDVSSHPASGGDVKAGDGSDVVNDVTDDVVSSTQDTEASVANCVTAETMTSSQSDDAVVDDVMQFRDEEQSVAKCAGDDVADDVTDELSA